MIFRVEITRNAAREIEERYEWLAAHSVSAADRWRESLLEAVESLENNPERYGEAPEAAYRPGLRQLLHGRRRHIDRVLFEIRRGTVIVLRVRPAARDQLDPEEI